MTPGLKGLNNEERKGCFSKSNDKVLKTIVVSNWREYEGTFRRKFKRPVNKILVSCRDNTVGTLQREQIVKTNPFLTRSTPWVKLSTKFFLSRMVLNIDCITGSSLSSKKEST